LWCAPRSQFAGIETYGADQIEKEHMIQIGSIKLTEKDLSTHLHGIGLSRSGKSKLIEMICRQLAMQGRGFCLIDPNGSTYASVVEYFAMIPPAHRVWLFESSNKKRVTGFYPFKLDSVDEDRIYTKAEKMLAATFRAWEFTNAASAPRLAKWLRFLYYALIEQQRSIADAECFLDVSDHARDKRDYIIAKIQNELVKSQFEKLYAKKDAAIETYLESTENRLQIFKHPHVKRIMGVPENSLDLEGIVRRQDILLINLQKSGVLSFENNRIIGTLFLNEFWNIFGERTKKRPYPYYLIVDECQLYATPDIAEMLDQAAKYGLHLMLFHQRQKQLPTDVADALHNAQHKVIFTTEDEKKPQRHFTYFSPAGDTVEEEVPEIKTYPLSEATVEAYKSRLLKTFLSAQEIDALLDGPAVGAPSHQGEITDEDLFR
jgi:type IV secretory pathway TraG/TraD family ATPase VirD4